jgi:hypothetical protein
VYRRKWSFQLARLWSVSLLDHEPVHTIHVIFFEEGRAPEKILVPGGPPHHQTSRYAPTRSSRSRSSLLDLRGPT